MEDMIPGKLYKYVYTGKLKTDYKDSICLFVERVGFFDTILHGSKICKICHSDCLVTEI